MEERLEASLTRGHPDTDFRQSPSLLSSQVEGSSSGLHNPTTIGSGASAFTRQTSLTNLEADDGTSPAIIIIYF